MLAFIATGWTPYARILRGDVPRVCELEFVHVAPALGAGDLWGWSGTSCPTHSAPC